MRQVTADDTPMLVLGAFVEPVEVINNEGKLLGIFVPDGIAEKRRLYAMAEQLLNQEEIERRKQDGRPGILLSDIFRHLLTLTSDEPTRAELELLIQEQERAEAVPCPTR